MAGETHYVPTDPNKSAMDYSAHEETYGGFLMLTKVASIGCVIALLSLLLVYIGWPVTAILLSLSTLVVCVVVLAINRNSAA
jgi:hypothetical protein